MKEWLKAFGKGAGYMGIFVSTQLIVGMIVGMIIGIFATGSMQSAQGEGQLDYAELQSAITNKVLDSAVLMVIISGVIAVGIVAIIFKIRRKKISEEINFRSINPKNIVYLALMGISLNILIFSVLNCVLSGSGIMQSYSESVSVLAEVSFLNFIATVVVGPFAEEVFYRGLMLSRFRKGMSATLAISLQAFLFGLMHGEPIWAIYTGVFGVILGLVAYREDSIVSTVIVHAAFNLTNFVMNALGVEINSYGIYIFLVLLSATVFIGAFVLLWKKHIIERPVVEEVEVLEVADLDTEEWMLNTKFHE